MPSNPQLKFAFSRLQRRTDTGARRRGAKSWVRKNPRRFRRMYNRSGRNVSKIALRSALSLKETKQHEIINNAGFASWTSSQPWLTFQPLNLDLSASDSESARESNNVYVNNFRLKLDMEPHKEYIDPFYIRIVKGWAKGSSNYGEAAGFQIPKDMIHASNLASKPGTNHYSQFDKDDWKILSDKTIRHTPKQIYDSTSGESVSETAGVTNDNRALWSGFRRTINWKFARKYRYEDAYGNSLVGWYPFVAIQIDRIADGTSFTGTTGSGRSPLLKYHSNLYFKDIH